jgi:hypothetical protein
MTTLFLKVATFLAWVMLYALTTPILAEPDTATSAAAKPADMLKIVVARRILPCIN